MSEKAPNTAVSAIIVVIIIFVAVIIFLNLSTDSSSQIIDLFNEVFYSEKNAEEEAKLATIKTQESFLNGIEECKSETTVNPKGKEACFCHTGKFGVISDQSFLHIQNQATTATITAYDSEKSPLSQSQEEFSIGLFAVKGSLSTEKELGCIFPSEYFINGVDEALKNNWYVLWKDARADKAPSEEGEDYTFAFYRDKDGGYLKAAPLLYKISDTKYCLLTDLIEHPLTDVSGLNYKKIYALTEEQQREISPFTDFFLDSSKYCSRSFSTTTENIFAPSGTLYWISEETGSSGESTSLFGTKWYDGYICGVDAYSFTISYNSLTEELQSETREIYNENTKGTQLSKEGEVSGTEEQVKIASDKEVFAVNSACSFRIKDFTPFYNTPILEINCGRQYADGYSAENCNKIVEGQSYFQNLAPNDIDENIPNLNNNGYDPSIFSLIL